jgi:hypothetical protein
MILAINSSSSQCSPRSGNGPHQTERDARTLIPAGDVIATINGATELGTRADCSLSLAFGAGPSARTNTAPTRSKARRRLSRAY